MRRGAPWLWLCLCALALRLPQNVATNVPPEDQDSSGDDSDNFSGSGTGPLPDLTLSHQSPPTWHSLGLLTSRPMAPDPTSLATLATSTSIPPAVEGSKEEAPVFPAQVEPDASAQEQGSTHPPGETMQHPTTHWASTTRATTAQGADTSAPHGVTQPGHTQTSVSTQPSQLGPSVHSLGEDGEPEATSTAAEDGASNQLPVGEGSGEQDFTFETTGESLPGPVVKDHRNQPPQGDQGSTGASQSLLDRKEVLGGVIAGGLVGLIFAVCLVAFMLYRMKKKDEGSYSLEEPKQANGGAYQKPSKQEEFYA
ncbi:syndecan-1 [Erinaceus europaeus]|uniref:Syndecan n=1 Tax=Erinaceus europaeus TaxID=9365 RepID=A0ABM3X199_ERIEU|nr:syndecan-1 [Erinaceus europaeus]